MPGKNLGLPHRISVAGLLDVDDIKARHYQGKGVTAFGVRCDRHLPCLDGHIGKGVLVAVEDLPPQVGLARSGIGPHLAHGKAVIRSAEEKERDLILRFERHLPVDGIPGRKVPSQEKMPLSIGDDRPDEPPGVFDLEPQDVFPLGLRGRELEVPIDRKPRLEQDLFRPPREAFSENEPRESEQNEQPAEQDDRAFLSFHGFLTGLRGWDEGEACRL
jgi:hypothetical protein